MFLYDCIYVRIFLTTLLTCFSILYTKIVRQLLKNDKRFSNILLYK